MREIKFRAWDKNLEEMFDVNALAISDFSEKFDLVDTSTLGETKVSNFNNLDSYVLMQYTGLKDKNDVEIYEGDIVRNHGYDELCIVNYRGGQYIGRYKPQTIECDLEKEEDLHYIGLGFYVRSQNTIEVIGNIHQNGDLLSIENS